VGGFSYSLMLAGQPTGYGTMSRSRIWFDIHMRAELGREQIALSAGIHLCLGESMPG